MAGTGSMSGSKTWLLAQHMLKIGAARDPAVLSCAHIIARQLGHVAVMDDVIVHRKSVGCERGAARTEQRVLQLGRLVRTMASTAVATSAADCKTVGGTGTLNVNYPR